MSETGGCVVTGDALELIPMLEKESVNLIVTSPPYPGQMKDRRNVEKWLYWLGRFSLRLLVHTVLAPNAVVVLNVAFKRTADGWYDDRLWTGIPLAMGKGGLRCLDTYMWHKTNGAQNGPLAYADAPGYEPVFVYTNADRPQDVTFNPQRKPYATKSLNANGAARIGFGRTKEPHGKGARQTNVLSLPTAASDGARPRAQGISFPRALPDRFIRQYTNPGDLVLDPFCGVATSGRVALELGRRFIGFELDPDEADRARAWLTESVQPPLDGQHF